MPGLYGRRWHRVSREFLKSHPYCAFHAKQGRLVAATVVDHIQPHRGSSDLFWDPGNWQPLCKACHDGAKQRQEKRGTIPGCDANGLPIDPDHHWR